MQNITSDHITHLGSEPHDSDVVETDVPVTYYTGAPQIVAGNFEGHQNVACLLWIEQLAKMTSKARLLKSRVERAREASEERQLRTDKEERTYRREVRDGLIKDPRAALEAYRELQGQTNELESELKGYEKEYCKKLEKIHALAYDACTAAGMPLESEKPPRSDAKIKNVPLPSVVPGRAQNSRQVHGQDLQGAEDMVHTAQANLAMYEPNLQFMERSASKKFWIVVEADKQEPSSDLGAESLHIWHIQQRARKADMDKYASIPEDARVNLLRLGEDLKYAQNFVEVLKHPERYTSEANRRRADEPYGPRPPNAISRTSIRAISTAAVPATGKSVREDRGIDGGPSATLSVDGKIPKMSQEIEKLEKEVEDARAKLYNHSAGYKERYAEYLREVEAVLVEKHGKDSSEVRGFTARLGRWSEERLAERFAPIFISRGRELTQRFVLAEQALDTLEVQATGLGIPSRPEQTSVFGSDSEGGVTSEYGQELMQTVNKKRIREWRVDTESGRVLTTEEAWFALSGATVGIEDSGSAVEADRGYRNKLIAANWNRRPERPIKRQRHSF